MIALARKYRPRRFSDLLVQDHVAAALRGAVAARRVGHGYLLTGPRGVGKTTAARILAMALNCERQDPKKPSGEPCGECTSCERIWSGAASLDVVEIDAASNRGVDDARELRERAMYAPSQAGHHKVYIVDEAHMLTREAWNALLKILEEPPPGVVFVFATTEPQKIANAAAPVMSRLQRFDFRRIGPAPIRERLKAVLAAEKLTAEDDALLIISRHADGGMRDALSVLDQCLSFGGSHVTAEQVREVLGIADDELYATALALVADANPAGVFPLVDRLVDAGSDLTEFVGGLAEVLRALLVAQLGGTPPDLTERMEQTIAAAKQKLAPEDAVRMLRILTETEAAVRRSANPRLALESLLLRWAVMDRTVNLEAVLRREGGTTGGREEAPLTRPGPRKVHIVTEEPGVVGSAQSPPVVPPSRPPGRAPEFTVAGIQALWPEVVEAGRAESRFLAEALAGCTVVSATPPNVVVRLAVDQAHLLASIEKGRRSVEAYLQVRLGVPVTLTVETDPPPGGGERPKRMSEASLRTERLKGLRGTDPALDTAVDELDLEIVDERPPAGGR
ncbi:MAG TPA: DNA polymerase III subunit gamma/tau [Gemmatimonadales bacterium]|nr:DNA polymerase III subunit gamma/tau [Gemmatimonadales bacterium]